MRTNLLLTGAPGVGKTTAVRALIGRLKGLRLAGFTTEEVRDDRGRRRGFLARTPAGEEVPIADVGFPTLPRVSRYGVDVGAIEALAGSELELRPEVDLYLIDEIGKMECLSARFVEAVRRLLDSEKPVVATVGRHGAGFISEAKRRPDAEMWEVTRAGRELIPDRIAAWLAERGLGGAVSSAGDSFRRFSFPSGRLPRRPDRTGRRSGTDRRGGAEAEPAAAPKRGRRLPVFGPGTLVTAAFIGPGTVTTATLAGARFGVSLLWALTFSVLATIVLQEMTARVALVTGRGLGASIRAYFSRPARRAAAAVVVVSAIALGNAAFQTGNLLGGALGLEALLGGSERVWAMPIAAAAFLLLWTGSYRAIESVMVGLVAVMSVLFVTTAVLLAPRLPELARGLLLPTLAAGPEAPIVAIGLIGTTVVPYNLFLHAAAVRERWPNAGSLPAARVDLAGSIALGGAVSMAIVVSAAGAARGADISNAAGMAVQLEPVLGRWARGFFATGLLAAGLSSAVTAPLAAAYATAGAMGWSADPRSAHFRAVWLLVLLSGLVFASAGVRPVPAILFAQAANGLLLPALALFLILTANDRRQMGAWANGAALNVAAGAVLLAVVGLGAWAVLRVLE